MSAKDNLNPRLFDLPEPQVTDVSDWAQNDVDTVWHASSEKRLPAKSREEDQIWKRADYSAQYGHPLGFHAGTAWAAIQRSTQKDQAHIHPLSVSGSTAFTSDGYIWTDNAANGADKASTEAVKSGKNVFYENESEDRGSTSVRAPRENLTTWAQDVVRNPQDASYAERAAVRKGAELVYSRAGFYLGGPGKKSYLDDDHAPAAKIALAPGLVGSEIDVEPEGDAAYSGRWDRLVPSLVYPKKKRTPRKPPQEETLF